MISFRDCRAKKFLQADWKCALQASRLLSAAAIGKTILLCAWFFYSARRIN
jgi:hypothetical protein